jgi:hypoxanthine phosphoribosyltransferase
LCSAEESALAVRRVAAEITARLADANPLVLAVMGGAVVFTGQLLPQLASRWISTTCMSRATAMSPGRPAAVDRRAAPPVAGRVVLVVDDILDEGVTMAAIVSSACGAGRQRGA